jgi:hypothetical protein
LANAIAGATAVTVANITLMASAKESP